MGSFTAFATGNTEVTFADLPLFAVIGVALTLASLLAGGWSIGAAKAARIRADEASKRADEEKALRETMEARHAADVAEFRDELADLRAQVRVLSDGVIERMGEAISAAVINHLREGNSG